MMFAPQQSRVRLISLHDDSFILGAGSAFAVRISSPMDLIVVRFCYSHIKEVVFIPWR